MVIHTWKATFTGLRVRPHFCSAGGRSHLHQGLGEGLQALKQEWVQNLLRQQQVREDSAYQLGCLRNPAQAPSTID